MTGQDWIVLLSGTVGTFGFSLLFCLHGRQLPVTTAGGALACLLWLLCSKAGMAPFFAILIASFVGSGYSTLLSRILKVPKTVFLLAVMISLVPGKGLYQTMRYAVDGAWDACFSKAVSTLAEILGIATGMMLVLIIEKAVQGMRKVRAQGRG